MKKVLFATTALVLSFGAAYAEVAVTGDARMGMVYDGEDLQFGSRARARFTMTGESDAGLSFGATFRVDHEDLDRGSRASAGTAGSVWVSGTYGKLSMGDVVSASEAANGDLHEVGYTDGEFAGDPEEFAYLTGDGENLDQGSTALYEYSINNINLFASMSDGSAAECVGTVYGSLGCDRDADRDTDLAYSLGANYDWNGNKFGLGYADDGDASEIVVSGEGNFSGFNIKGIYADYSDRFVDGMEYDRSYGLSVGYEMANGVGLAGFIRRDEFTVATATGNVDEDFDTFGIGASYDLGGGATLAGGIIDSDYQDDVLADVGLKFKF